MVAKVSLDLVVIVVILTGRIPVHGRPELLPVCEASKKKEQKKNQQPCPFAPPPEKVIKAGALGGWAFPGRAGARARV